MKPNQLAALCLAALAGCNNAAPEPLPDPSRAPAPTTDNKAGGDGETKDRAGSQDQSQNRSRPTPPMPPPKRKVSAKPTAEVKVSADDPVKGKWTVDDATKGMPPGKTLSATIDTDQGSMECTLFPDKAPITVANFVGLARGNRPWKTPEGKWEKKPAYDGTIFHRVIKGFMIQGGDAKKDGTGEAGYVIPDEIWEDANHDRAGLLCMANRGPNTNSAQFFITDAAANHLDVSYTIFGECAPLDVVHKIGAVETAPGDRPRTPVIIKSVTVRRK